MRYTKDIALIVTLLFYMNHFLIRMTRAYRITVPPAGQRPKNQRQMVGCETRYMDENIPEDTNKQCVVIKVGTHYVSAIETTDYEGCSMNYETVLIMFTIYKIQRHKYNNNKYRSFM